MSSSLRDGLWWAEEVLVPRKVRRAQKKVRIPRIVARKEKSDGQASVKGSKRRAHPQRPLPSMCISLCMCNDLSHDKNHSCQTCQTHFLTSKT